MNGAIQLKKYSNIRQLHLIRNSDLSPTKRLIAFALALRANDQGLAWPSIATISGDTGLSERTIQTNLRALEGQGLELIESKYSTNCWRVDFGATISCPPRSRCTPPRSSCTQSIHISKSIIPPIVPQGGPETGDSMNLIEPKEQFPDWLGIWVRRNSKKFPRPVSMTALYGVLNGIYCEIKGKEVGVCSRAAGQAILGLWRYLGFPELNLFESDAKIVAIAAHKCPDKRFSRDIRAEGWADGINREKVPSTVLRQDRFEMRLEIAKEWKENGMSEENEDSKALKAWEEFLSHPDVKEPHHLFSPVDCFRLSEDENRHAELLRCLQAAGGWSSWCLDKTDYQLSRFKEAFLNAFKVGKDVWLGQLIINKLPPGHQKGLTMPGSWLAIKKPLGIDDE